MSAQKSLSEELRTYFTEINKLYTRAVEDDNSMQIEALAKSGASLAKQIKEHELHEGKTVTIVHAREMSSNIGRAIARATADIIGDREVSDRVMARALQIIKDHYEPE